MKLSLGKCWGLLIFDTIGFALSGYAFLLVYQVLATLPSANAFIILMAIFVGIKVIILSLYDLNRNLLHKNIPFIGGLISLIGNGIVFGICWFLIPTVPLSFFIGLAISDFLVVTLCHFLWWSLIGKDDDVEIANGTNNTEDRKAWLSHSDEEDSEYDSIFTTLLENEKQGQQKACEPTKPGIYEDEKRYQTSDFLKDIKQSLANNPGESSETKVLPVTSMQQPKAAQLPSTEEKVRDSTFQEVPLASQASEQESQQKKKSKGLNDLFKDLPSAERSDLSIKDNMQQTKAEFPDENLNKKVLSEATDVEKEEDFIAIERRLGYLFYEIEKSMEETHFLQDAVSEFHDAVETYTPITGDEKIIATGNLIREKLKDIIDKQFVVDEVLDDLIRLSKLINNRIDDLDVIEAGLNQRKMVLDQKEVLMVENYHSVADEDIEIMPQEVMLENLDSEFIIAEGDYESIRKYLTENTEK